MKSIIVESVKHPFELKVQFVIPEVKNADYGPSRTDLSRQTKLKNEKERELRAAVSRVEAVVSGKNDLWRLMLGTSGIFKGSKVTVYVVVSADSQELVEKVVQELVSELSPGWSVVR